MAFHVTPRSTDLNTVFDPMYSVFGSKLDMTIGVFQFQRSRSPFGSRSAGSGETA
jgi:hypothetical protein